MSKIVFMSALADALNLDTELDAIVNEAVLAPDVVKQAPAQVARHICMLTPEQQSAFVEPNTRQKDRTSGRGVKLGDNIAKDLDDKTPLNGWDFYDYTSKTTGERIRGQWYKDMVSRTTRGIAINKVRDQLRAAKDGDKTAPEEYLNLDEVERDKAIAQYDAQLTRLANVYRTSVEVIRLWAEITERVGHCVEVDWRYVNDGDPSSGMAKTNTPIKVYSLYTSDNPKVKEKPALLGERSGPAFPFSVSDFLNLDIDKAIEKGVDTQEGKVATYVSLIKSERTKPAPASGKGKSKEAQAVSGAVTPANFLDVSANVLLFMQSQDKWMAFLKEYASLPEGNEKKDQYRLTMGRMEKRLSVFMQGERKAYLKLELDLKRKEEAEAEAQDKADAA